MEIPKAVLLIAVAMIAGAAGAGLTAAVNAGASGGNVTYYACLKSGKLTSVGTAPPACAGTAMQISRGSQGPQGIQGLQGLLRFPTRSGHGGYAAMAD